MKKASVIQDKWMIFIKMKSKDLKHGTFVKYKEVIKHKSDHKNYRYI